MGPKRKKSKPNPENESSETAASPTTANTQDDASVKPSPASNRTSWYNSTWRSKASPVATVARESISVAQGATTESSESARTPSSISKSMRGSRKSIPLVAEPTRVHATSDASSKSRPRLESESEKKNVDVVMEDAVLPPTVKKTEADTAKQVAAGGTWFSWWSRPDGYGSDSDKKTKKPKLDVEEATRTPLPGISPVQSADETQPMEGVIKNAQDFEGVGGGADEGKSQPTQTGSQHQPSRSWFGLWSSGQNQPPTTEPEATEDAPVDPKQKITVSPDPPAVEQAKRAEPEVKPVEPMRKDIEDRRKTSGWAFWSSDKAKDPAPTPGGTQKQVGELAVADTPSQNHPEAAQFNEHRDEDKSGSTKGGPKRSGSLLRPGKRASKANSSKSITKENLGSSGSTVQPGSGSSSAPPTTPVVSEVPTPSPTPPPRDQHQSIEASSILTRVPDQAKPASQQTRPNLVLPSFGSTFSTTPNPGYVERLSTYLAQAMHLPGAQPSQQPIHVYKSTATPRIKKAVAMGIHGYMPGALIQKFIGQPKGTSVRLSNYAANAIKTWCAEHQGEGKDEVEIEKVSLEGEGTIAERVSILWKLLLNWLSHLRQADFILVACHSQGVPVAIMLVAKLIQLGALSSNVRLGVSAMAGINLGPFLEYRSRLFGGVALELFDFCDNTSRVSRVYAESLELCLRHGVRVTFVGSIDDQLVSLESALNTPISHPYLNRAVFVDGQIHAPNFLTHLVVFAIKLRNLGVSDHGLIRQLSAPLAGSLVGGEGHSRIYDEPNVYRLAIDFALGSTDIAPSSVQHTAQTSTATKKDRRASSSTLPTSPPLADHLRRSSLTASLAPPPQQIGIAPDVAEYEPPPTSANANPFVLPWAVRGMLEEELVKREMKGEVEELVKEFEAWKPTSKVLRDVRWRLEGVRGMI